MNRLPRLLLVLALALAAFAYGWLSCYYGLFPYQVISDGIKTLQSLRGHTKEKRRIYGEFGHFADTPLEHAVTNRFQFVEGDSLSGPVLWEGGRYRFLEYCPDEGCLAVEYTATGEVAHAYPFRSEELEQAAAAAYSDEFPYEQSPTFSFATDINLAGISRYMNGDLLAIFRSVREFPFGAGVARIDRDGHPIWFRRDYSHHWPLVEDDGVALVPGMLVGSESISFKQGRRLEKTLTLKCGTNRPHLDTIGIIDGNGQLLKRINLLNALRDSPFAYIMQSASGPLWDRVGCDSLHLNFVHRLGDDAGGTWGLAPGDLVVSLRNISAFAILDGESGRVKRLVRGSFFYQHSVQHLTGATFLMFDNYGHDGTYGPSRLLMIDLADGRETTLFPNDRTPKPLQNLFTASQGSIDISPDRTRALVTFTQAGVVVEVRLADGAVLNVFHSLHDVSNLEQFPEERQRRAAVFEMGGIYYIRN